MPEITIVTAPSWKLVFRQITSPTDERTVLAAIIPRHPTSHSMTEV